MLPLIRAAKSADLFRLAIQTMRLRSARARAYGPLAHRDIDALARRWTRPALSNRAIAEDLRRLTLSFRPEVSTDVAARLPEFDQPALVAWSGDDEFFPRADGERLSRTLPNAHLEVIARSRTFSMVDQPDRLAEALRDLIARI